MPPCVSSCFDSKFMKLKPNQYVSHKVNMNYNVWILFWGVFSQINSSLMKWTFYNLSLLILIAVQHDIHDVIFSSRAKISLCWDAIWPWLQTLPVVGPEHIPQVWLHCSLCHRTCLDNSCVWLCTVSLLQDTPCVPREAEVCLTS